jgi:hypothetical protein
MNRRGFAGLDTARAGRSPPTTSSPRDTRSPTRRSTACPEIPLSLWVGNLTADPEPRFTASGVAVADFTVASTPRIFDRASGEWKDGDALFLRCTLWRQPAETSPKPSPRAAG